jgi:hypothetical protein
MSYVVQTVYAANRFYVKQTQLELKPDLQLDPPNMEEQLRQALNNRRAVTLTCYGTIILVCIVPYLLYLLVVYIGMHH